MRQEMDCTRTDGYTSPLHSFFLQLHSTCKISTQVTDPLFVVIIFWYGDVQLMMLTTISIMMMMILMMFIISFSSSKIINMNMVVIRFLSVLFFISFSLLSTLTCFLFFLPNLFPFFLAHGSLLKIKHF